MRLVTGSRGPLGFALQQMCSSETFFADSSHCDLTDFRSTITWLSECRLNFQIDSIFHLAARSGGSHQGLSSSANMIRDNILMAINLLEGCAQLGIKDVILVSSTAAYPTGNNSGIESSLFDGPILSSDFAYGYAKRFFVPLMNSYNFQHKMRIKTLFVNGIIGPNMNFSDRAILPAALISRFIQTKHDKPLVVWGDGTPTRQYTFSLDLAKILIWSESFQQPDSYLNVGSMESVSVRELAELVCQILELPLSRLYFDTSKPNGRLTQKISNETFMSLNHFNYTNIETALRSAIDHYLRHQDSNSS